jgi:predicted nucleotidyltransferase component of viral defense system
MSNSWFSGNCILTTYEFNELVGTKMRALYQRRKGRDLFDLYKASFHPLFDIHAVIDCFNQYMAFSGNPVPSQKEFLVNLEEKMKNRLFLGDTVI